MLENRLVGQRSGLIGLSALVALIVATGPAAAAQARSSGSDVKDRPGRAEFVAAVLEANPQARQITADRIHVADGIELLLPATTESDVVALAPPSCASLWMCFWEHASSDGFGAGFRLTKCGTRYDLGGYRYPDFVWVGTGASGPKWNDRISSWNNTQSNGTVARLYNWVGSWRQVATSTAPDFLANARERGVNDIIDSVIVC